MKTKISLRRFPAIAVLYVVGIFNGCSPSTERAFTEEAAKKDRENVRLAVESMYSFISTKDLSDSLVFAQWTEFFTRDFVRIGANGQSPNPMGRDGFKEYREVFKTNKAVIDGITLDQVDTSGGLGYALFHFHEVVTSIQTNSIVRDALTSAVATFRRDAEGKWKIAVIGYL